MNVHTLNPDWMMWWERWEKNQRRKEGVEKKKIAPSALRDLPRARRGSVAPRRGDCFDK